MSEIWLQKRQNIDLYIIVKWEINAPAETEGAYLESLMLSPWSHQGEFLVQAGSSLKITNATYSNGTWHLKADLIQE